MMPINLILKSVSEHFFLTSVISKKMLLQLFFFSKIYKYLAWLRIYNVFLWLFVLGLEHLKNVIIRFITF